MIAACKAANKAAWEAAWQEFYDRYRQVVLAAVSWHLGARSPQLELVEELAARVWFSLCDEGFQRLHAYDPGRSQPSTFLSALARAEVSRYKRELHRQHQIGRVSFSEWMAQERKLLVHLSPSLLEEFLASLSGHERRFCRTYLLGISEESHLPRYAHNYILKLRSRIRRKLRKFLYD